MKFALIIITIIVVLLIGIYYGFGLVNTGSYAGPSSDHFDGKKFFNKLPYHKKSILDLFRWWFSGHRQTWPVNVPLTQQANIVSVQNANEVRITFVNHATFLIQTKNINFLTDPVWSLRVSPFSWMGPKRVKAPGIPFEKLPPIHVVIITHNHYDHLDLATLQKLNERFHPLFIVPLGNKIILTKAHIDNVLELDWWQQYKTDSLTITLLPAQHWSSRWLHDKFDTLWGSYGIEVAHNKILFAGDAGYSNRFVEIKNKWGIPDLAFLPIGSYKPEWFMKDNHLNPEEAVKAHMDLQSKLSIPMHYGTFQLSDEGIDEPELDLKNAIEKYHISSKQFTLLREGECMAIRENISPFEKGG